MRVFVIQGEERNELPFIAREACITEFLEQVELLSIVVNYPSSKTDYWYAPPGTGKTTLSLLRPNLFLDCDVVSLEEASKQKKIYLSNRLDLGINYHFYLYPSASRCYKFLMEEKNVDDRILLLSRFRLANLGYQLLYYFDKILVEGSKPVHLLYLKTNTSIVPCGDTLMIANVAVVDVYKYKNSIAIKERKQWQE